MNNNLSVLMNRCEDAIEHTGQYNSQARCEAARSMINKAFIKFMSMERKRKAAKRKAKK
jgi:hypothetical protein